MRAFFRFRKKETLPADKDIPATDAQYTVIDTELTGLNEKKDAIVSIGAVKMTGMKIEIGRTFHQLIKPRASLKPESVVIHGITPSDVRERPESATVLSGFLEFCAHDILIGHCVSIDLSFLNREMKKTVGFSLPNPTLDTFSLYAWLRKYGPSHDCLALRPQSCALYEISKCFGIPVKGAHDALMDSFITAQLFQRFLPILAEAGITNTGTLLEIGTPYHGGDEFKIANNITNF
ncbi:MAG: PolC-type DNA polymerase III [Nitrospirota bacterium]